MFCKYSINPSFVFNFELLTLNFLCFAQALSACQLTISVLFHPPSGVLFTFPSRYSFTIGRFWYLALDRGRPGFPHSLNRAAWYLGTNYRYFRFRIRAFHSLWKTIPDLSATLNTRISSALQHLAFRLGLGCSAFARRY